MAVENVMGVEHRYAPNPKMEGEDWVSEFPPIVTSSKWLINRYTKEVLPNTVEFAQRSDILEPYHGQLPTGKNEEPTDIVETVLTAIDSASHELLDL